MTPMKTPASAAETSSTPRITALPKGLKMDALLERVKAATGPDRAIDRELEMRFTRGAWAFTEDHFTSSLDRALALVERVLPGWTWSVGNCAAGGQAYLMQRQGAQLIGGTAANPALALMAAMLAALSPATAVQEQGDG